MTKPLRDKFPSKEINADDSILDVLNEQFKDLAEKVKSGDYVVRAKDKGRYWGDRDLGESSLNVTLKPSAKNTGSSIEVMTFNFLEKVHGGKFDQGITITKFKIKTTDGKTISSSYSGDVYGFLEMVRKLGREKIAQDERAPSQAAIDAIKSIKL